MKHRAVVFEHDVRRLAHANMKDGRGQREIARGNGDCPGPWRGSRPRTAWTSAAHHSAATHHPHATHPHHVAAEAARSRGSHGDDPDHSDQKNGKSARYERS